MIGNLAIQARDGAKLKKLNLKASTELMKLIEGKCRYGYKVPGGSGGRAPRNLARVNHWRMSSSMDNTAGNHLAALRLVRRRRPEAGLARSAVWPWIAGRSQTGP